MKKLLLFFTFFICSMSISLAQIIQFEPHVNSDSIDNPFYGVGESSSAFSDIDNDGDQDVLITGRTETGLILAKLYTNDGAGNFILVPDTPFEAVFTGSIAFSDIDGDGDQDLLITGIINSSTYQISIKLYTNDGAGAFSLVSDTPFEAVYSGSIAFSDIDNDGDQDVLITGNSSIVLPIAKLYTNDGTGVYSLVTDTPFTAGESSTIAFSDIDDDGDQDVMIAGDSSSERFVKLYSNDGTGTFSLVPDTPFEGVYYATISFADIDGDSDQDVLITGYNSIGQTISQLYTNDVSSGFTLVANTPFDGVYTGSVAFSDIDNDGDQDVLITGYSIDPNQIIAKLYTNDGSGVFTLVSNTPFDSVYAGSVAFSDIDNDGDQDVLITGWNPFGSTNAKLYINDSSGVFTNIINLGSFEGIQGSSIAFSDTDNDGDQDVLITGLNNLDQPIAKLYTNNGFGLFTMVSDTPFVGVWYSSIAFSDVDNDGDQDVLITGKINSGSINSNSLQASAKLYTNDGSGVFSLVSDTSFIEVQVSSIAFSDIDSDGDQDVLITGSDNYMQPTANLYANDGAGVFTLVNDTPFIGVNFGSIAFSDIDGDSDQDVLITGENGNDGPVARLYTNHGGVFNLVSDTPFEIQFGSSIAFSDIDNDGDQDVLIVGPSPSSDNFAKLYLNDGAGVFNLVPGISIPDVQYSSIAFTDIDADGDQDVLITGFNVLNQTPIAQLYTNDSKGVFTLVSDTPFDGVYLGSIAFSDIDNDDDQDIMITGNGTLGPISKLYINKTVLIRPKVTLTVTADNKEKYSGEDNPLLTYSITGFINNETIADIDELPIISATVDKLSVANTYPIVVSGGLDNNYNFEFLNGELLVKPLNSIDASQSSLPVSLGSDANLSAIIEPAIEGIDVTFTLDDGDFNLRTFPIAGVTNNLGIANVKVLGLTTNVYKITVKAGNESVNTFVYMPVYDPNGGFVTGGGWINSPIGALVGTSLTGKANFGFISKYKKGSNQVDGNTEFMFTAGNLNFKSTFNEIGSLVIAGSKAIYKGVGTINGIDGYKFMVSVIDGQYNSSADLDKFRIKIWSLNGVVIYDNQIGSDENADANTDIGGGSIVIHQSSKVKSNTRYTNNADIQSLENIEMNEAMSFKVLSYPNPTKDYFILSFRGTEKEMPLEVNVFDIRGRLVFTKISAPNDTYHFGEHFDSGVYIVNIQNGLNKTTIKVIKE